MSRRKIEIDCHADLSEQCASKRGLAKSIVQGLDLTEVDLSPVNVEGTYFIGCTFRDYDQHFDLIRRGGNVFPEFEDRTFNPYRSSLYTADELLEGWDGGGYMGTRDFRTYEVFDRARNRAGGVTLLEAMAQRLHDHAIDDALYNFIEGVDPQRIVAIMGGHGTARNDPWYRSVVQLTRKLTRRGYVVASGGGPGIMEAANLGAFLANFSDERVIDAVLEMLAVHAKYNGGHAEGTPEYLRAIGSYVNVAYDVRRTTASPTFSKYGRESDTPGKSLAIPTWFYGHEPTNVFCDNVAKYFSNGIREDTLLAIARGGVVFAPGSAGTLQEVFMDLAQNHYATFVDRSPMCFFGSHAFTDVYALVQGFIEKRGANDLYGDLVMLSDSVDETVTFLEQNPPRPRNNTTPLYELPK